MTNGVACTHRCREPQVVGVPAPIAPPQTAVMDTTEQNKNTVTSFIQALFTKGDLGAVDDYLAGDFTDHATRCCAGCAGS